MRQRAGLLSSIGVAVALIALVGWTGSPAVVTAQTAPADYATDRVNVKFVEGTDVTDPAAAVTGELRGQIVEIDRLFSLGPLELQQMRRQGNDLSGDILPDLNLWFQVRVVPSTDIAEYLEALEKQANIEIVELVRLPTQSPVMTPNFEVNQGYLEAAPNGVDARRAWTFPGGSGAGVKIYDVEYSWNQNHEDLATARGVPLLVDPGDIAIDPFADNNHGTAVLGELIGTMNIKGVTGVSWSAQVGLVPPYTLKRGYNVANAILLAVADGSPGDIIQLEQQQTVCGFGAPRYGPSEGTPSVFSAIQTAVTNGFVVVAAAGNGSVDLDQTACGSAFDRTVRDSGAIIVGAGLPPSSGTDRQRALFSSFGSRIDVQGWGVGVATTGYGVYRNADHLEDVNGWYTSSFSGTSSATPIVAGAAANLQGIALRVFGSPLTSLQIRTLLTETGSPQLGNMAERIGPRPDLNHAIAWLTGCYERGIDLRNHARVFARPDHAGAFCGHQGKDRHFPRITSAWPTASVRQR